MLLLVFFLNANAFNISFLEIPMIEFNCIRRIQNYVENKKYTSERETETAFASDDN